VRTQLNWTQYKSLLSIDNEDKREFYIAESVKNNWTSRQMERQINSSLYKLIIKDNMASILGIGKKFKKIKTTHLI